MSVIDRAGDGPDASGDVPRRESAAAGVDHGTVLVEARARRECALAYRATVQAVYEEAGRDVAARRPSDSQAAGNPVSERPDMA